jgi:hypothetical protein
MFRNYPSVALPVPVDGETQVSTVQFPGEPQTFAVNCVGVSPDLLFGPSAHAAGRRTKEIGFHKVFGARRYDVVPLLIRRLSMAVLIANGVAWSFAYCYLHGRRQGLAHRICFNPLYFFGAGMVALMIAWVGDDPRACAEGGSCQPSLCAAP